MNALLRLTSVCAGLWLIPTAAALAQADSLERYCMSKGGGPDAVRTCRVDYLHAVEMFRLYYEQAGLVDESGEAEIGRNFKQIFRWQTLFGVKTPALIAGNCVNAHSPGIGMLFSDEQDLPFLADFPAIWDCIKKHDPEASRLEAI